MYYIYARAGDQHVGAWCFRSPVVGNGAYVYRRISYLFENPSKCMPPSTAPHRNAPVVRLLHCFCFTSAIIYICLLLFLLLCF